MIASQIWIVLNTRCNINKIIITNLVLTHCRLTAIPANPIPANNNLGQSFANNSLGNNSNITKQTAVINWYIPTVVFLPTFVTINIQVMAPSVDMIPLRATVKNIFPPIEPKY